METIYMDKITCTRFTCTRFTCTQLHVHDYMHVHDLHVHDYMYTIYMYTITCTWLHIHDIYGHDLHVHDYIHIAIKRYTCTRLHTYYNYTFAIYMYLIYMYIYIYLYTIYTYAITCTQLTCTRLHVHVCMYTFTCTRFTCSCFIKQKKAKKLPFLFSYMRSEILPDLHLHTWLSISSWKRKAYNAYVFHIFILSMINFSVFFQRLHIGDKNDTGKQDLHISTGLCISNGERITLMHTFFLYNTYFTKYECNVMNECYVMCFYYIYISVRYLPFLIKNFIFLDTT